MKFSRKIYINTGDRFGRWTVIKEITPGKWRMRRIECKCDCGVRKIVLLTSLMKGKNGSRSCGCLQREMLSKRSTTHGLKDHLLYRVWKGIKSRCFNPSRIAYKNYGGRGITIYEEWKNNPVAFVEWCLANGWNAELTIDRIDNNGHYEPSNIQFISKSDNSKRVHERKRKEKKMLFISSALSLPV